jgi:acyl-CoA thioesterase I
MKHRLAMTAAILSLSFVQMASPSGMKRILVFGDSLSEGFGLAPNKAYPVLLAAKLRADGLEYEITNASQSGGTTEEGLHRLPRHLKRKIDIFILELGINDAFRGISIDQIRVNLQEIIDRVRRANPNVRIIVCGMQLPDYTANDYVAAFGQMYSEIAAKNKAALVPYLLEGLGGDPALIQPDRIHPNAAGQRVLAENVWRVLEPIAREVANTGHPEPRRR